MLKTRKRWISLLVTLAMLVAFVVPFAGTANAGACSYTAVTTIPEFDPGSKTDDSAKTGPGYLETAKVQIKFDPGIANTESIAKIEVLDGSGAQLDIEGVQIDTPPSGVTAEIYNMAAPSLTNKVKSFDFRIVTSPTFTGDTVKVNVTLKVDAKDCAAGDIKMNVFNATGQFEKGSVVVARAAGSAVTVGLVGSVPEIGEDISKEVTFRLSENAAGALKVGTDPSVKIKLPAGFEWSAPSPSSGTPVYAQVKTGDSRTLEIYRTTTSNSASVFDIKATVSVKDTDTAKMGDVVATVEGGNDTSVSPSEITVASYQEYGVNITVDSVKTLLAGKTDQKTDKIKIEEKVPGTLVNGRKITVEFPDWVKVVGFSDTSVSNVGTTVFPPSDLDKSDNKFSFKVTGLPDNRTSKAKLEFKVKLNIEANRTGDIVATVSGAGIPESNLTVAKAVVPVSASATPTDVKIGVQDQTAPDIVITEAVNAAIAESTTEIKDNTNGIVLGQETDTELAVILPNGVQFSTTPKVEVTSGDLDLKIDQARVQDNWNGYGRKQVFVIPVKSESIKASTIKISGIKLTLDRTVPEGPLMVKIGGNAVVENDVNLLPSGTSDYLFRTDYATEFALANCVTPAPGEQKGTAVFKIGEAKYTVNGQEYTMDVAPVAEAGRTYLPARFVANAMGVPDSNIIWDQANQTVTVIRNDRIVQMKVGSNQILVNGIALTMDVAPKVVPGRVLIPFRFLAQALGAEVVWDAADPNTITLNF